MAQWGWRSPVIRPARRRTAPLLALALGLLGPDACPEALPSAVVQPDRSRHVLDRPFPSDELLTAAGTVRLEGFPRSERVGQVLMDGWLAQVEATVRGFSSMTPVYLLFSGELDAAPSYPGLPGDDVRLFSLDSDHRVPLRTRSVADPLGDPYLRPFTLVVMPDERFPLRSGERYAAVVSRRLARRAHAWQPPAGLPAGDRDDAAVATVFTVQDLAAELAALREATDAFLDADASLLVPEGGLREVARLRYEPGQTPSGRPATAEVVEYADGGSETTFLRAGAPVFEVDLTGGPFRVWEGTLRTAAFQDPEGRPYQSLGIGILGDANRSDGWIAFDAEGALLATPRPEPLRVVVQVPREAPAEAVLLWGHGSGGDAYEAIQRTDPANDIQEVRRRLAARGSVVVSADQPLFGRRFPLIDQGYDPSLAVVNVGNLPAFRDNVRQGAVDQRVLVRFVDEVLPGLLEARGVSLPADGFRGWFGHSIGAQISGVAAPLHAPGSLDGILMNGTGGFETHSVLAANLFSFEGSVVGLIFDLAGIEPPEDPTPPAIFGAAFGIPEAAWAGIDRHHPLGVPFQLVIDGADPLAVAAEHELPVTVHLGEGDSFVPPDGGAWLAEAPADGRLVPCTPSTSYDGHFCIFREESGFETFEAFVSGP